ncbi:SusC/RagA family TonB-linked outer membrane protein [Arachidicoccus terrestris]|uniref:SusC/RagA family TonB-linked outer membrane protein n=1 Tax=Arachidicoccus terrestris TaxID=2875539 RepID=UPI001CC3F151|nr:SusC/RagA family TonB-linked outer membrane protein [Arachidicoccus terrestris]UAY55280.1 SusC/RagA family TonB-linked outer membrane protein [Arachidicoccus terrestris]
MGKQYRKYGLFFRTVMAVTVSTMAAHAQTPSVGQQSPGMARSSTTIRSEAGIQQISGLVIDLYNKPLAGVMIKNRAGKLLASTDSEGTFTLDISGGSVLYFTLEGYDQKVEKITGKSSLQVRMRRSFLPPAPTGVKKETLTDVTAADGKSDDSTAVLTPAVRSDLDVLYGSRPAGSFLGAAATTTRNELSYTPAPQYTYGLPGRLAGLNVIQTQGFYTPPLTSQTAVDIFIGNIPTNQSGTGPTDNTQFNIQLRGHNSSYGQSPIVVIDGVQRELYSLDPDQIQSVTVLKDALSTILLGQNSSRGALIVTTLEPVKGAPRLSFTAQAGIQQSLKLPKPLSAGKYAYLLNEALLNDGKKPAYTAEDFAAYQNGSDPYGHPDVNWYDQIIQDNPLLQRYNINVTGGGEKASYLVDLGYMNQDGMFIGSDEHTYSTKLNQKRYSINSKIRFKINRDFDLGLNLIGRIMDNNQPGTGPAAILSALLNTPNNAYPVYNPDGSFGGTSNYTDNLMAQVLESGYLSDQERDIMVNLDMRYKLDNWVPGWWVRLNGNVSVQSASFINRSKQVPIFQFNVSPSGDTTYNRFGSTINQENEFEATSWARYWYAQASTGYDKTFGQHQLGLKLFYDQKQTLFNYDLPSVLSNYAFQGQYNYAGKYFAEAALNYSGYSRYQAGHRYGLFYAGGLGWDIAKEKFIRENLTWINQLKLRGTYGKTGNANVDNYGYYIWNKHFQQVNVAYQIGSEYPGPQGVEEGRTLPNVNATWEKANKLDIGLDITLFNYHLQASFDYYHERYADLMQNRGKSIQLIGLDYPAENIGRALYHGLEGSVTYQNSARNFNYYITGNASLQYSKVLFMDEQAQPYFWNFRTGLPVGQRFGLIAEGFIQTADEADVWPTIPGYVLRVGDVKYKDMNSDGVIDQFDMTALGHTGPLFYYGLSGGFSVKGFELNFLIQGVQNRDIYVNNLTMDAGFLGQNNGYGQAYEQIQNRWTPETAGSAVYPALSAGGNGYNYNPIFASSSLFLHNGNYIRLKNVGIAYTLPYSWTERLKVGSIKVFANALNLWTWAAYDSVDPEISLPSYPMQRVINTGINIKL